MLKRLICLLPLLLFVLPGSTRRITVYAQDYTCTAPTVPFQPLSPTYDATTGQQNQWLCIDPSTGKVTASGIGGGSPGGSNTQVQFNNSSAFGGDPNFTYATSTGLLSHVNPGIFTNTQNNFYNAFNLGGCSPSTVIAKTNAIQSGYGTANYTDAASGCIDVPSGATMGLANAISGYAINDNTTAGPYGSSFANAVQGTSYCRVGTSECEGLVGIAQDDSSLSGVTLVGAEVGMLPQNTSDTTYGYLYSPFGNVQPTKQIAFYLHNDSPYTSLATSGFECGTGSLTIFNTFFQRCFIVNPKAAGASAFSQCYEFVTTNGSSANVNTCLLASVDAGGKPYLRYNLEGSAGNQSLAALPDHASATTLSPSANLTFATCTMSSGTCTYTFTNAYIAAPICTATWNGTGTLTGILKAVPGTTSVVLSSSVGTDNDTVDIVCGPQAN